MTTTIAKWLKEFTEANAEETASSDPDFIKTTEPELLDLFASWFNIQLDSLFNRAVQASTCLPDLEGGITVLFDGPEERMFPFLTIDVWENGYVHITRAGQHADTVVHTTIDSLEENPVISKLVEEFL